MNALKTKLTPDEAGKRLGVRRAQVSIYINRGYLKATNVGDGLKRPRWQIDQDDLDYFIENKDKIIPKRGGYRKKAKVVDAKPETKVVAKPDSYLDQKYVTDLLRENRDLRKQLEEVSAEVLKLAGQLRVLKDSNADLMNKLEETEATKDKMVEDIFGILANNE